MKLLFCFIYLFYLPPPKPPFLDLLPSLFDLFRFTFLFVRVTLRLFDLEPLLTLLLLRLERLSLFSLTFVLSDLFALLTLLLLRGENLLSGRRLSLLMLTLFLEPSNLVGRSPFLTVVRVLLIRLLLLVFLKPGWQSLS